MVRAALVASIYAKTTDVDITTLDDSAAVTLMGTDVERITNGMRNIHELWANTVEIAMGIYLLQLQVGLACLVSLVVALSKLYLTNQVLGSILLNSCSYL